MDKTFKNVDEELWLRAKAQAALERKPLKHWLEEAIKEKLDISFQQHYPTLKGAHARPAGHEGC